MVLSLFSVISLSKLKAVLDSSFPCLKSPLPVLFAFNPSLLVLSLFIQQRSFPVCWIPHFYRDLSPTRVLVSELEKKIDQLKGKIRLNLLNYYQILTSSLIVLITMQLLNVKESLNKRYLCLFLRSFRKEDLVSQVVQIVAIAAKAVIVQLHPTLTHLVYHFLHFLHLLKIMINSL